MRILTVTGTSTASTVALISDWQPSGRSRISAEPASPLTTFLHRTAHIDIDDRRAAIGIEFRRLGHFVRVATGKLHRHRLFQMAPRQPFASDWRVCRIIAGDAIISVTFSPDPKRRTSVRNGMSVTPVIGARITGAAMRTGPI